MNRGATRRFGGQVDHRMVALLAGLASLGGCQMRGDVRPLSSELAPPPSFATAAQECRATEARFALGRTVNAPLLEEMRVRAGAASARTILPTDAPAPGTDMRRLNVDIEPSGRIIAARCG